MLQSNHLIGFGVGGAAGVTTLISGGTGSTIGNMTSGAGLAAGFDGNTSQASGSYARAIAQASATIGKDWGSGNTKTITQVKIYPPNDDGYRGDQSVAVAYTIQGSPDNSAWTTIASGSLPTGVNPSPTTILSASITQTTAYRYHRLNMTGNSVNGQQVSELEFYEDI